MMRATITVMPKENILDPQGNAIRKALHDHGMQCVEQARVGKYIDLKISGTNLTLTRSKLNTLCAELLSNPIIEDYTLNITLEHPGPLHPQPTSSSANPRYATRLISHLNTLEATDRIPSKEDKNKPKKKGPSMATKKNTTKKAAPAKKAATKKPAAKKTGAAKKAKK